MAKRYAPNAPCPCGSGKKYKKCCAPFHKGALANDARTLMRSRYSAYAVGDSRYIIETTHPDNPDFTRDKSQWLASIDRFCEETDFLGLEVHDFLDGEREAFVTFTARLSSGLLKEKSRFLREDGRWLYVDGQFF
jgi:SEC-C motif-containing protein